MGCFELDATGALPTVAFAAAAAAACSSSDQEKVSLSRTPRETGVSYLVSS